MLESLIQADQRLMLFLNGSDSLYLDGVMKLYSSTWIWLPLAAVAIFILLKNNKFGQFLLLAVCIAALIFICDRVSSGIIKPMVCRLRPSNEP